MASSGRHISLPKPFAPGDVSEWCQRFEICSKANEWNNATMALKLPTLLEGEALAVWLELTDEQKKDYKAAKKELVAKMAPMGFASLEDLHRRKLLLISAPFEQCVLRGLARKVSRKYHALAQITYARSPSEAKSACSLRATPYVSVINSVKVHAIRTVQTELKSTSVFVYVHDLERLLDQALPELEANARKQFVLHQFISGLPTHVSTQIRATGDTKELGATVKKARLLMAIGSQAPSPAETTGSSSA